MPVVTVELAGPAPSAIAHALIDACSTTVREGRCVLSTEPLSEPSGARASVIWDDASERVARIEVVVTTARAHESRTRALAFKESDARVERWRTVGLTIATLVGDVLHPPSEQAKQSSEGGAPESTSSAGTASGA